MTLQAVARWQVPQRLVTETEAALREVGSSGHELFALWSGRRTGSGFEVLHLHVPDQFAYRTESGVGVRVEGPALHALNVWLFEHEEALAVQIHSHPDHAYHSPTDDAFPIVTTIGGLSIVLAWFGRDGLLAPSTACYRLTTRGFSACQRPARELFSVV